MQENLQSLNFLITLICIYRVMNLEQRNSASPGNGTREYSFTDGTGYSRLPGF